MRTTVSIPRALAKEMEETARDLRIPKSVFIRQAIERRIRTARFHALARRMRRYARKQGIVSEEQIFEMVS